MELLARVARLLVPHVQVGLQATVCHVPMPTLSSRGQLVNFVILHVRLAQVHFPPNALAVTMVSSCQQGLVRPAIHPAKLALVHLLKTVSHASLTQNT
jgi:hypothetical protein